MIEIGTLRYLKMSHEAYEWTKGKKLHYVISTIKDKPVAVMQENEDGTYLVSVRNDGHVLFANVFENDFRD